jgi:hypothetical protein
MTIQENYKLETGEDIEYVVHRTYFNTEYVEWLEDRLETALEKNRKYEMLIENKEK